MYHRIANPAKTHSFFLFGARGTGKTRLLRQLFGGDECTLWIDLLEEGEALRFLRSPGELREVIDGLEMPPPFVVIDEVQRVPALLNEVHSLIEERQLKFALTGSSARKLKRGGANLLGGRAILNELFPLTFVELAADFSLDDAIAWGTLPAISTEKDPDMRASMLRTYVDVYLREEIREEQIVRSLDPFARFLEAAAQCNGTILNYSRIGREAGTDAKGVQRYFQILEDTLLGFFLEPYHRSIRKRQRQQAKFYLFDTGVKRALEGMLHQRPAKQTYEWGKAFEHLVILEAYRLNSYLHADYRFSYLKTQSQLEVDLVAERRGDTTWVIEIKSANDIDRADVNKLKALSADIPHAKAAVFCSAQRPKMVEGVNVLPWQMGLRQMYDLKE